MGFAIAMMNEYSRLVVMLIHLAIRSDGTHEPKP